jgi:uncharacterized protein (UPF0303 family)
MTYNLESLAREQRELLIPEFSYAFAWRVGVLLHDRAVQEGYPIAITVAQGSDLIFSVLMPGAVPDNLGWAARKRAVVNRFHRSSLALRLEAEASGRDFYQRYGLPRKDYAASGGGVPLTLAGGSVVGCVAVSGLPDVDDHRIIVETLRTIVGGA